MLHTRDVAVNTAQDVLLVCFTEGPFSSLSIRALKQSLVGGNGHRNLAVTIREINKRDCSGVDYGQIVEQGRGRVWDIVGISVYVFNHSESSRFARFVRASGLARLLVVGGPYFTWEDTHDAIGEFGGPDIVVVGEGEAALGEIVRNFSSLVTGMPVHLEGMEQEIRRTGGRTSTLLMSLEPLPLRSQNPAYTSRHDPLTRDMVGVIETSRGCRNSCVYCAWHRGGLRHFPLAKTVSELTCVFAQEPAFLLIADSNLFTAQERAAELLDWLRRENAGCTPVQFFIEADGLTEKLATEMVSVPSIRRVEIGLQSSSEAVCRQIGRRLVWDRFREAFGPLRDTPGRTFVLNLDLIVGLPSSTYDDNVRSIEDAIALKPDCLLVFALQVVPGSALFRNPNLYGIQYDRETFFVRETATLSGADIHSLMCLTLAHSVLAEFPRAVGRATSAVGIPHRILVAKLQSAMVDVSSLDSVLKATGGFVRIVLTRETGETERSASVRSFAPFVADAFRSALQEIGREDCVAELVSIVRSEAEGLGCTPRALSS